MVHPPLSNLNVAAGASVLFDADGDGVNDFKVKHNTFGGGVANNWLVSAVGGNTFIKIASSFIKAYSFGNPIMFTSAQANGSLYNKSAGGPGSGNFGYGTTKFFAFRKASPAKIGFVEIQMIDASHLNIKRRRAFAGTSTTIRCSTVLGVEFLNFKVKAVNKQAVVSWETANEQNNQGFEILRSLDGKTFSKIGFTKGQGTTNASTSYGFVDENPVLNQVAYYQIRQLDFDGKAEIRAVGSLKVLDGKQLVISDIFPNPNKTGVAHLNIEAQANGKAEVTLFSSAGIPVRVENQDITEGVNALKLDISGLAAGHYYAKVAANGQMVYKKLVITK